MASIQEVLAALDGKKSPFVNLLEGVTSGFATAQDKALENAKTLIALEQNRQQMERQAQMDAEIKSQIEQQTRQRLNGVTAPNNVLPVQKLQQEISQDENGKYSRKWKTVDTTPKEYGFEKYVDSNGVTRTGRANKVTGEIEQRPTDPIAPTVAPSFQVVGAQDGSLVAVNPKTLKTTSVKLPGEGPLTPTTQTEGQANAKLFASRMEESNRQINDLSSRADLTSTGAAIQGKLPNIFKGEDIQLFEQSKRNFLNAVLRRESGAVISPTEFAEGNKQYFPVYGDSDKVLAQKKANRETAIAGLKNASGGGTLKIRVSNGTETYEIDPADLEEAKKDGFQEVK